MSRHEVISPPWGGVWGGETRVRVSADECTWHGAWLLPGTDRGKIGREHASGLRVGWAVLIWRECRAWGTARAARAFGG